MWRIRKAALAGVRARAAMIRSPSFSRDSESRTTMGSPRAGGRKEVSLGFLMGFGRGDRGWERMGSGRTEGFNGFGDGVEGGLLLLGGAVWLLLLFGGRHCCG